MFAITKRSGTKRYEVLYLVPLMQSRISKNNKIWKLVIDKLYFENTLNLQPLTAAATTPFFWMGYESRHNPYLA
jgi:hypothetical protein